MKKRQNLKATILTLLLLTITVYIPIIIPSIYAVDWSPDMRITWNANDDRYPSLAQTSDGKIWFVWHSDRTGDYEIFYKLYDPTKTNPWSYDIQLTNTLDLDITPSIMHAADSRTWVAWTSRRTGNYEIYYKIYNGDSWTIDMPLTDDPNQDDCPSLMQTANGTIWLFWSSSRTGNREIFYKMSSDNGGSWTNDRQLTFTAATQDDTDPSVTQSSDEKIWLVWTKNWDIYYKTHDGVSWSSDGVITNHPDVDMHPSIAQAADGKMWTVWDSNRTPGEPPQNDIYYSIYDGNWGTATQLTTNDGEDDMPSIMRANDGLLWVVWSATRLGLHDIYYRTNSIPPPHDVAVFSVKPSKTIVVQGNTLTIEVVAQNHGTQSEIFNIDLYANSTLIGFKQNVGLPPGELYPVNFNWDTSSFALDVYTLTANVTIVAGETNTADNTYVDGTVTVAIRDVAVTSVAPASTSAYQGYGYIVVFVGLKNEGTVGEEVTVTAYYNSSIIGIQTVSIEKGSTLTLTFIFDTEYAAYGIYILSADADLVPDETDLSDNYLVDGTVVVHIPGDINGDRAVNIVDWSLISAHWYPGPPRGPSGYDPVADVNMDGAVNIMEVSIVSAHWGQSW